jgi:hypothetical protein
MAVFTQVPFWVPFRVQLGVRFECRADRPLILYPAPITTVCRVNTSTESIDYLNRQTPCAGNGTQDRTQNRIQNCTCRQTQDFCLPCMQMIVIGALHAQSYRKSYRES